jgi:tRNA G46 methylase TrmB
MEAHYSKDSWRRRLVDAYFRSAILKTQKIANQLVLGHQDMYTESRQASLIQIFLKSYCGLNSDSAFVDLGCGLGNVVYLASIYGVQKSIGVEVVPQHLVSARNSMKKLKAQNVELIEGDIKDKLRTFSYNCYL